MFKFIFLLLVLLTSCSQAFASNIISIRAGRTASGDAGKFAIMMQNDISVNGLHFTLRYSPDLITVEKVTPVNNAGNLTGSAAYLDDGDKIRFIVYDEGYNFITYDSSDIFEIEYFVTDSLPGTARADLIFTEGTVADSGIMRVTFEFINSEIDIDPAGAMETLVATPLEFALHQNYPNPFNPATRISFVVGRASFVTLKVYDILGREVATLVDEKRNAGKYEVIFSARRGSSQAENGAGGRGWDLPSGVYFYRLQAGNFVNTKKLILVK